MIKKRKWLIQGVWNIISAPNYLSKRKILFVFILSFIIGLSVATIFTAKFSARNPEGKEISFSDFKVQLESGAIVGEPLIIDQHLVIAQKEVIAFQAKDKDGEEQQYFTTVPTKYEISPFRLMENNRISAWQVVEFPWSWAIFTEIQMTSNVLMFFIFIWLIYHGQIKAAQTFSKGSQFQKISGPKITFADVAGVDEAKEEVAEVISFLGESKKYEQVGARMPHGILLYGPPGTGKTLLAKAAAHEAGIPCYERGGSSFHEMFVGVGSSRFRDLIKQAIKNAPSTVILDEVDSAAPKRVGGASHGTQEYEALTNEILHSLDMLEKNQVPVILFAITNRPDMLDPALLRAGRLDRHIEVPLPNEEGRMDILQVHLNRPRPRPLEPDMDLRIITRETRGFSGADLAALVNEAAIRAARRSKNSTEKILIQQEDFQEAILRVLMGPQKKLKYRQIEKEILAWHEAGHALAAKRLPETDEVRFATILPRGRAGGFTRLLPVEEIHIYTQTQIFNQIKIAFGGRAAEEVHFQTLSTGSSSDLEIATNLARNAVCVYGMSKLGPIYVPQTSAFWESPAWQGELGKLAELEIKNLLQAEYDKTLELLRVNEKKLDALARKLLEKLFIPGHEIDEIINNT